jgi:hypothetical protein
VLDLEFTAAHLYGPSKSMAEVVNLLAPTKLMLGLVFVYFASFFCNLPSLYVLLRYSSPGELCFPWVPLLSPRFVISFPPPPPLSSFKILCCVV